jgi:ectoine hydroxylase-related dioxygenase (phytanoyl-CoA dioxygenase family)
LVKPPAPPDPAVVSDFDQHGFTVIRDALDGDLRAALLTSAQHLLASSVTRGRDRGADGKDGFRGTVNLDPAFLPLVANPRVLPAVVALLSPNIHLLSSHLIALASIAGGEPRSIRIPSRPGWHRDMYGVTNDLGPGSTPRLAIKCAYFLTPVGPDTGTTMFLPQSHRWTDPVTIPPGDIDPPGAVTPKLERGDAVLFENRTWHAGGLNTSGTVRIALMMQYGYRWLAPVDDPADNLLKRGDLTKVEHQFLGALDRAPDGSLAKGAGAAPLRAWWQTLGAEGRV